MQLAVSNLTKVYSNGVRAIDNLSLEIGTGMFGLLGPNGAGKSTLMRTIATLQLPDSGTITFRGIDVLEDPMRLRRILGYLPQEFGVYPRVSAENLLDYFATLKGVASRADRRRLIGEVLEITNLYEVRKKYVDSYSGGMKQRFGIAQLLLNNPQLIIVDEPTAGLDPAERRRFLNILREVGARSTVIFSTHIMQHAERLCDRMLLITKGQKVFDGTLDDAHALIPRRVVLECQSALSPAPASADILSVTELPLQRPALNEATRRWEILLNEQADPQMILQHCFEQRIALSRFDYTQPSLHDVFVHLVGSDAREHALR